MSLVGVAQIFRAALGPYVPGLTNVTSKCRKRHYVLNDMSVTEGKGSRHVSEQGAVREALEDTCQEHCGGARNCILYGTDRTKYRIPYRAYKYLQAVPY